MVDGNEDYDAEKDVIAQICGDRNERKESLRLRGNYVQAYACTLKATGQV